ncbi:hypothetical protein NIES4101_74220 [Calothrix sp. NIES-4101]|nr:hypothetical protein NIES4101_74220 [Calothrix sp. NIES-4101]
MATINSAKTNAAQILLQLYPHYYYVNKNGELAVKENARFDDKNEKLKQKIHLAIAEKERQVPHNSPDYYLAITKNKIDQNRQHLETVADAIQLKLYTYDLPERNKQAGEIYRMFSQLKYDSLPALKRYLQSMDQHRHEMLCNSSTSSEAKQSNFDHAYESFKIYEQKFDELILNMSHLCNKY